MDTLQRRIGIVYFSGTGNTEFGLKILRDKLIETGIGCDLFSLGHNSEIPDLRAYDLVGFGAPVYHGYPAQKMIEFIEELKRENTPTKAFTVLSCCFKPFDIGVWGAKEHFIDMLEERGIEVISQLRFFGEASHPFIRKLFMDSAAGIFMSGMFGKGCPDRKEEKRIVKFASYLSEYMDNHMKRRLPDSNIRRWLSTKFIRPFVEARNETILIKSVDKERCSQCGLCVDMCPAGAISMSEYPVFDRDLCIECQKCINLCLKNATVYKVTDNPGRYRGKREVIC